MGRRRLNYNSFSNAALEVEAAELEFKIQKLNGEISRYRQVAGTAMGRRIGANATLLRLTNLRKSCNINLNNIIRELSKR